MKNLTVHQRINFKSHFPVKGFDRVKRPDHYGHHAKDGNYKSFDIPFWNELQDYPFRLKKDIFNSKI